MPVYLDWLAERVLDAGGSITRLNLHGLPRTGDGGPDAVVNCSGIGAKFLAADPRCYPVQGQVVLVEQAGLERWWLDGDGAGGPTYVVPRSRDIVVGGTDVEGEWSRTPSPEVAGRDPAPGAAPGARAGRGGGARPQGRAAARAPRGAAGAGR